MLQSAEKWAAGCALVVVMVAGCGLPRDPEGTCDRVRGGTIRAGVTEHPPWTTLAGDEPNRAESGDGPGSVESDSASGGEPGSTAPGDAESEAIEPGGIEARGTAPIHEPGGIEPYLLRRVAHRLSSTIDWRAGPESRLIEALRNGELDVVVGGLEASSPWSKDVGLTRPYVTTHGRARVMAVRQGENCWLLTLDTLLHADGAEIRRLTGGGLDP